MSHSSDTQITPVEAVPRPAVARPQASPISPGKVALWLFLATEVMFFTGLIGSYIVLRAGSPPRAYANLFPPGIAQTRNIAYQGLKVDARQADPAAAAALLLPVFREYTDIKAEELTRQAHHQVLFTPGLPDGQFQSLGASLTQLGAEVSPEPLRNAPWPRPYDQAMNPLNIDLTALNTFILICSSVTMVLALSAIQQGRRARCSLFLFATILLGGTFLGIQVYEYRQLLFEHHFPIGVSPTGHFRPDVSLFASCFFTMTGFHGLHVAGGLLVLSVIFLRSLFGPYTASRHASIELAGLYWHFVDLVWILLFTIVYLI